MYKKDKAMTSLGNDMTRICIWNDMTMKCLQNNIIMTWYVNDEYIYVVIWYMLWYDICDIVI